MTSLAAGSRIPSPVRSCCRPTRGRSGLPFPSNSIIFHLCVPGSLPTTSPFISCGPLQLPSEENVIGVITCHRYLQIAERVCYRRSYLLIVVSSLLGQALLELYQTAGPRFHGWLCWYLWGWGAHKVYAGFLKTKVSSPVLFIQKGEI